MDDLKLIDSKFPLDCLANDENKTHYKNWRKAWSVHLTRYDVKLVYESTSPLSHSLITLYEQNGTIVKQLNIPLLEYILLQITYVT